MTYQTSLSSDDGPDLSRLPRWIRTRPAEETEAAVFLSGAALAHMDLALRQPAVPLALLRDRLALRAAVAAVTHGGRVEREADLRDAVQFLRPGDHPGPAGAVYCAWRMAVAAPVSAQALSRALPQLAPEALSFWLGAGEGTPVDRAAGALQAVLLDHPRLEAEALVLADAALARALGWRHVVPLLASGLARRDLRREAPDLRQACHRAVLREIPAVLREVADLTRRADLLRKMAPKLRAKGRDRAVAMFLEQEAIAPAALTACLRSSRAARRFCDRLVSLDLVRELTGRDSFRLYGL